MPTNNTKQAAWVAVGSFFSFGIGIVSSMILSRYFNKADYGTYKQVLYVYNTLLLVFTLGLPRAYSYFLPRVEPSHAKSLINKLSILFFLLGTVFSLLLFFFSGLIATILKNPDLEAAIRVFAVVPVLMLPTMGLEGILSTYKKTQFLAIYTIATRLLMLLCISLPVMIWHLGYMEAIIGFVVSSIVSCLLALILKYYPVRGFKKETCTITYKDILHFSLPLLYASLWGLLINSADQFFISRYFGNEEFAVFSNGSMDLPFVSMVVGACSTVLSPVFSRMKHEEVNFKEVVYPLWISVFEKTAKLVYPMLAFCWVFAVPIMTVLYGEQYENSAIYFRLKMLYNIFHLIAFAPLLINTGKVKFYSNVHAYTAVILVFLEFICALFIDSPYMIVVVSLICKLGLIFVLLSAIARMFNVRLIKLFPIKVISQVLIPSLFLLYIEYFFLQQYNLSGLVTLLVAFLLFLLLFAVYSQLMHLNYTKIVKPLILK